MKIKDIQLLKKHPAALLWTAVLVCMGMALLLFERDLLWKMQSMNLFLADAPFFKERMLVPAGMLSYAGAFFTQLLYQPWLGVVALCAWWWLVMWLTSHVFRLPARWAALTVVPMALMAVIVVASGYWVYALKMLGWVFAPAIGLSVALAALWVFRVLLARRWQAAWIWMVLAMAAGYPLAGVYAIGAVLVMAIWSWRLSHERWHNALLTLTAVVLVAAVPLICYRTVYYQTNIDDLWYAGLPAYCLRENAPSYYIPYILLGVFYVLLAVLPVGAGQQNGQRRKGLLRFPLPQTCIVAGAVLAVWLCWFKDANFHHELRMARHIEHTDWIGVLKEGKRQGDVEPTRAVVLMHNIALWREGLQADLMYDFPKGSQQYQSPVPLFTFSLIARMLYYQYGLLNECHRMCMEEGVEMGWRVEHLQYLTRCAVLGGERQVALKYLNMLRKTMFYGSWADQMEHLLDHPELIEAARETGPISHMLHYNNQMGADGGYTEKYIMSILADQDSDDPLFQEQTLLATMWKRDPDRFWPRFFKYAKLHPGEPIPRIYQEAAYLFANLQNSELVNQIPFDEQVKRSYHAMMSQMKQYQGMPREALYSQFGNTYYFEYFFLKDITYY